MGTVEIYAYGSQVRMIVLSIPLYGNNFNHANLVGGHNGWCSFYSLIWELIRALSWSPCWLRRSFYSLIWEQMRCWGVLHNVNVLLSIPLYGNSCLLRGLEGLTLSGLSIPLYGNRVDRTARNHLEHAAFYSLIWERPVYVVGVLTDDIRLSIPLYGNIVLLMPASSKATVALSIPLYGNGF